MCHFSLAATAAENAIKIYVTTDLGCGVLEGWEAASASFERNILRLGDRSCIERLEVSPRCLPWLLGIVSGALTGVEDNRVIHVI